MCLIILSVNSERKWKRPVRFYCYLPDILMSGSINWWTLVKSLTGNNDISRTIPPIEHNGNLVFDDIETAELFNKFFCEQSNLI
jgi:hypothetical protein